MVNQKAKLRQAAFNINHKIEGKLRVGSFSSITALWMPGVIHFFKEHYPKELQERFKQMDLEEEAPEIIMDMTQKLGFRDDYDRFYRLFIKDIRDGKLGRYTLDTLGEIHGND